ncbi:MAG: DoxX-like family protein [Azonexus sp.]
MGILICGANGFLGQALERHLTAAGHQVVRGMRRPQRPGDLSFDFTRPDTAAWAEQLAGIDTVINCVGIFTESAGKSFPDLHQRGPQALFAACRAAGVRRVVQVSALGTASGSEPYFTSKRAADEFLMQLPIEWQIVRPALIYGADGHSAGFFRQLASLPVLPLPAGGKQVLQAIHIDDLCAIIARLLDPATPARQRLDLVGPAPFTLKQMLLEFRRAMGFAPALCVNIPAGLMRVAAHLLGRLPGSLLTPDSWRMLQAGSPTATPPTALRGRPLHALADFIPPGEAKTARLSALAAWRNPLLRASLALVWLITGLLSLGIYPIDASLALLTRTGLSGTPALIALYGAAGLDLALGWATLFRPGRRLWLAQMALIAGYSLIIALCLPEFLIHPFGPLSKNLPILALLFILLSEENAA